MRHLMRARMRVCARLRRILGRMYTYTAIRPLARSVLVRSQSRPQDWIGQPIAREDVRWIELGERATKHRGDEYLIARTAKTSGDDSGHELADMLNRNLDRVLGAHGRLGLRFVLEPDIAEVGGH
jgi:hypothetical protein